VRGINLRRRAFDLLNTIECIPGCIGAFRRSVYDEVGTYDFDTLVEDMDLTIKFIKTRGLVRQENRAIVYTEAPETLRGFIRQRLRWYGGGVQAISKHRPYWWRFGALSFLGYPYVVAGMTLVPAFELMLVALSIIQVLAGMWFFQVLYWSAIAIVDIAFSTSAVLLDKEDWRLIPYSPIYALFYRHFNDIIRLKSYWDLARGRLYWRRTRAERQGGLASKIKI
jgi:cellulose synthase/poly-beta-1,6-N-acetylglucosamine synthase-like glycosyltransferase